VILGWNQAASALYEISTMAALGKQFRDLDVSYRVEGLRARIEEVKVSRVGARLENISLVRRSGEITPIDVTVTPLLNELDRVSAVAVTTVEVAERVRLREEVIRLAEQHAMATEQLQSTNEELETTNEELQSTNEELETTNEELQSTNEELLTTVDELQAANTQLVTRTDEARRLAVYQKAIVDSVSEVIVVLDRAFLVTSWNRAAERLWGLRASDALGRPFSALPIGSVTSAARDGITRIDADAPTTEVIELPVTMPDGLLYALTLRALVDANREMHGVLIMAHMAETSKG
jgi:two-component system, chemotaxis family, CheB/CheR fusion protein